MTRHTEIYSLVVAGAVVGALASASGAPPSRRAHAGEPVSPVVFPEQAIPLRFSHAFHIEQAGAECDDCHENAATSESSLDSLIPTEEPCRMCHAIERDKPDKKVGQGEAAARCDACHVGFEAAAPTAVARVAIPAPNIKFNHKAHVAKSIACSTCHGDLAADKVGLATRDQLPKMSLCLDCHDGRTAPRACVTCHIADPGGMVKTVYDTGKLTPSGVLRGDDHDLNFRTSHRFAAQNDEAYCQSCHRKEFCVECHNGVVKPMDFHANDYVTLHTIDARRNTPDCSTCHRLQTFCVGCHSRSGVVPDGKGGDYGSRDGSNGEFTGRFHPEGWIDYDAAGPVTSDPNPARGADHHSFEAQRNIKQCAACHREDFCLRCHSRQPGSYGISPHPNGWLGSRRCKALAARAGRMCLRCHIDAADIDCDTPLDP